MDAAMNGFIGVDWGSTGVRAFRIAPDGTIRDTRRAPDGVFSGSGAFDARLRALIADWPDAPILLCGMVGSDRGWRMAPYVPAPAGAGEIAAALLRVPFERPAHIVPGLSFIEGETCEVMRGEEALVLGLLAATGIATATACLPGTHSKWVETAGGCIIRIRTFMTGELRAALLGRGTLAAGVAQAPSLDAFRQGLAAAADGATRALFQARARRLLGRLAPEHTAAFVEGVLVGAEIACAAPPAGVPLYLVANGALCEAYAAALSAAGIAHSIIDPEPLAALGLAQLARSLPSPAGGAA